MNAYEKYKKVEDLPVAVKVTLPPEGMVRKGIIQLHHGMSEHKNRYAEIMQFFSERGYICAIHDMRGHGENTEIANDLGYFGEEGFDGVVEDAYAVTAYLKNNYPDLPLIFIGHSFGSIVARAYLKKYDVEVDRAFIVGSPSDNKMKSLGMLLIEMLTIFRPDKEVSELVHNLVMGRFDKVYKKNNPDKVLEGYTENMWICSDMDVVKKYNKDPKSGFKYTMNGYYTILNGMVKIYSGNKSRWAMKNKDLKITFLSGENDPCMISEDLFLKAVDKMKEMGYRNVDYKLYPEMQHEIFNEPGKYDVYEDIYKMINE